MSTADGKADTPPVYVIYGTLTKCSTCGGSGRDKTVGYWLPCQKCGGLGVVSREDDAR